MTTYFQELRDQWALKAPNPGKDWVNMEAEKDRQSNPHNEPYLNKRPRRSEAEIISDLAYTFADTVLENQYGFEYSNWLKLHCEEKWGVGNMLDNNDKLEEAKCFIRDNLEECCRELLEWHDTAILCTGKVREAAKKCSFAGRDALALAEGLIEREATLHIINKP